MNKKKALIFGINDNEGAYLIKFLLNKGYKVFGVIGSQNKKKINFKSLSIDKNKLKIFKIQKLNQKIISKIINQSMCEKIFFLSKNTYKNKSKLNPIEIIDFNIRYFFYILEACKKLSKKIKIYNLYSSKFLEMPQSSYDLSILINFYLEKYYKQTSNLSISNDSIEVINKIHNKELF